MNDPPEGPSTGIVNADMNTSDMNKRSPHNDPHDGGTSSDMNNDPHDVGTSTHMNNDPHDGGISTDMNNDPHDGSTSTDMNNNPHERGTSTAMNNDPHDGGTSTDNDMNTDMNNDPPDGTPSVGNLALVVNDKKDEAENETKHPPASPATNMKTKIKKNNMG